MQLQQLIQHAAVGCRRRHVLRILRRHVLQQGLRGLCDWGSVHRGAGKQSQGLSAQLGPPVYFCIPFLLYSEVLHPAPASLTRPTPYSTSYLGQAVAAVHRFVVLA